MIDPWQIVSNKGKQGSTLIYTDPITGAQIHHGFSNPAEANEWARHNVISLPPGWTIHPTQTMGGTKILLLDSSGRTVQAGSSAEITRFLTDRADVFTVQGWADTPESQQGGAIGEKVVSLDSRIAQVLSKPRRPIQQGGSGANSGARPATPSGPTSIGGGYGAPGAQGPGGSGAPDTEYRPAQPDVVDRASDSMFNGSPDDSAFNPNGGSGSTGPSGVGPARPVSDAEVIEYIRANYGVYYASLVTHPEIGAILLQAGRDQLSAVQLYGRLSPTVWWQQNSKAMREWKELTMFDPATANTARAKTREAVIRNATKQGVPLTAAQVTQLVEDINSFGWTDQQALNAILDQMRQSDYVGGDIGAQQNLLKKTAAEWMLPLSDTSAFEMAMRIQRGTFTLGAAEAQFAAQAKARYPYISQLIDQGVTPGDYFGPLRQTVASELGVPEEQIDMMDPKWAGLSEVNDPKTGLSRAATNNEARVLARSKPEWQQSDMAQETLAMGAKRLMRIFGGGGLQ